jgi:hypothetical protein
MTRFKQVIGNLLVALFGIALAVLAVEVLGRLVPDILPESIQSNMGLVGRQNIGGFIRAQASLIEGDPYLGLRLKPNMDVLLEGHPDFTFSVHTDPLGFEGIGFREDGPVENVYAVAVGDSFTFGVGVDASSSWVEVLQSELGLEVVNMGLPSASTLQYTRMLEQYGLALHPQVVLYEYYPADLIENTWFNMWLEAGSPGGAYHWQEWRDKSESGNWFQSVRLFLEENSITVNLLLIPLKAIYHAFPAQAHPSNGEDTYVFQGAVASREELDAGRSLVQESILEAQRLAQQNGAQLVVVLFPTKDQIAGTVSTSGEMGMDWVLAFCEANAIRCLDLTPAFLEHAGAGEALYFPIDGHWNEQGNRLAASLMCQYLASEGLIPAGVPAPSCAP